jgi:hypothetical protein
MEPALFLQNPTTEFERPLRRERSRSVSPQRKTHSANPDQGLYTVSTRAPLPSSVFAHSDDFEPLDSDSLTIESVNHSVQQTLNRTANDTSTLHRNLSTDKAFQAMLENLGAELKLSPDGQNLRVEAKGGSIFDWFPADPSSFPAYIPPQATPPPPPEAAQGQPVVPSSVPFYVPSIPPTESFYDRIYLDNYGVQVALFYQTTIIQFADLIAGHLDLTSPEPILRTGYEDIVRLTNKLDQSNQQFIASFRDAGTPPVAEPGQKIVYSVTGGGVELSPEERKLVDRLKTLTTELQNPNQALSIYREERLREVREKNIQLEWYTLPTQMQTLYFTSNVSAAINLCLDIVAKSTKLDRTTLLDTIIRSDARDRFAALVASRVKNSRVRTANSYHTGVQYDEFDAFYHDCIRELSKCNFQPTLPPFIKMLRARE